MDPIVVGAVHKEDWRGRHLADGVERRRPAPRPFPVLVATGEGEGVERRVHGGPPPRVVFLTPLVQRRILRLYVRRALLSRAEADDMLGWRGTGGFSLHGSVRVAAHDRAGLERLLWYCARPPFALHRPGTAAASAAKMIQIFIPASSIAH